MGVPGADDVMLRYQSTSFHDALHRRRAGPQACAGVRTWLAGERFARLAIEARPPERLA